MRLLPNRLPRLLRTVALTLATAWLAGCAVTMPVGPGAAGPATYPRQPQDPFEPFNRQVMVFNDHVDAAVLRPAAVAYRAYVPRPIRVGVGNVLSNISDVWSTFNSVLQLKPRQSVELGTRVAVNTVLGLGGLLDVASEMGLEHRSEDFGQTLGRWGVPPGPFLMLPLLGPSSVRDAAATFTLDRYMDPLTHINHENTRWALVGFRVLDTRTNLLRVTNVLDDIALDRYSFTRDAYLQRRLAEVGRGRPSQLPVEAPGGEVWDGREDPVPAPGPGPAPAPGASSVVPLSPPSSPLSPSLPAAPAHNVTP